MMMPSQTDVLRRALDKELLAADIKLVGKYVKDVLFEKNGIPLGQEGIGHERKIAQGLFGKLPTAACEWRAGASKRRGGVAIHEHCVEFDGKGWVLQQLVVKQKVKLVPGSSEFIHE
jgi:hypothetical protein